MDTADASAIASAATSSVASVTGAAAISVGAMAVSDLPGPDLVVTEPTPPVGTPTPQQRPDFVSLPSRKKFDFHPTNAPGDSPGSAGSVTSGATTAPSVLNVLVVDDDPLTRKLMTRMLTRLGCVCDTAENGLLALELLLGPMAGTPSSGDMPPSSLRSTSPVVGAPTTGKYAVVFLDNQMPLCSGLEVVRQLRSLGREDFVVGVTGNALKEDQEEYYEAGVDQLLTKPVLERSLKQMLVMADERRRARASSVTT